MLSLASFVQEHALRAPERTAIRMGEKSYTYAQLDGMASAVANYLVEQGLQPGDHVALSCPNLPYFPMVYYGILKAGCVVVPLNVLLKAPEIEYHLNDSDAQAYFVFEGTDELPMGRSGAEAFSKVDACKHLVVMTADPAAQSPIDDTITLGQILNEQSNQFELVPRQATDTAVILYTSGTTGRPKGAELSQLNMAMNAMVSTDLIGGKGVAKDHIFMMVLPLFHSFGQTCGMNAMFYSGGQITMLPRFDAAGALETMQAHDVTVFAGVPTMYWGLLGEAKNLSGEAKDKLQSSLQYCMSGGSALAVELLNNFEETFQVPIMEGYGLSETSPVASFNHADRERKPGTVGQAIFGVEIKVVDENDQEVSTGESGEIIIRGHNVMKGYYDRPDETEEALRGGWFHSGDVGVMDDEGYVSIVDRIKDMIVRGGYNVYPREVEEVLMTHPAVSLAAVIGIPSEEHGEEIAAYLVLEDDVQVSEDEMRKWSKEQMAAYKYPREINFVDSLPMNATGKILRRELRAEAKEEVSA